MANGFDTKKKKTTNNHANYVYCIMETIYYG